MKTSLSHGFTIIEVVLVLAIAGLIFLMVFVALPSLQRSQRDTQRRNDMSRVVNAIIQYQTNNNSILETGTCTVDEAKAIRQGTNTNKPACNFIADYLNQSSSTTNEFKDPDGTTYGLVISNGGQPGAASSFDHRIHIRINTKCVGDQMENVSNQPNFFAVAYKLEGSGSICLDNQ